MVLAEGHPTWVMPQCVGSGGRSPNVSSKVRKLSCQIHVVSIRIQGPCIEYCTVSLELYVRNFIQSPNDIIEQVWTGARERFFSWGGGAKMLIYLVIAKI